MPRQAIFLGDLLRALHGVDDAQQRAAAAQALGFEPLDESVDERTDTQKNELTLETASTRLPAPSPPPPEPPPPTDTRTQPWLWRVAADLPNPDAVTTEPDWLVDAARRPLTAARFESDPALRLPAPAPLVQRARLLRLLQQRLARPLPAGVPDVPWLVRRLSSGLPVHRLRWLQRPRWPHRVHLLCQAHPALGPLAADGHVVAAQVQRLLGRRVHRLHAPGGPQQLQSAPYQPAAPLRLDGAPVLVLGDAGLLQPGGALAADWQAWAAQVTRAGPAPLLLAPLPRRLLPPAMARHFQVALLDDTRPAHWLRPPPAAAPSQRVAETAPPTVVDNPATTALLGVLAGLACVDHALLRLARRALQPLGADVALEAQVLQHAAVTHDAIAMRVRPGQEATVLAALAGMHARLQASTDPAAGAQAQAILHALANVNAVVRGLSPLLQAERQGLLRQHLPPVLLQAALDNDAADRALQLWQDAAAWLHTGPAEGRQSLAAHLQFIGRTQLALVGSGPLALQAAWAASLPPGALQRRRQLPPGLQLADLQWLQPDAQTQPQALVLQGGIADATVQLLPQAQAGGALLATGLPGQTHATLARIPAVGDAAGSAPDPAPLRQGDPFVLHGGWRWRLFVGARQLDLEAFQIPTWAQAIERDGPHWRAKAPDGRWLRWVPQSRFTLADAAGDFQLPHGAWWDDAEYLGFAGTAHRLRCPGWANVGHGVDAHGYWAAFAVAGEPQMMRFIPPGAFEMGSPSTDRDRFDDERPHPVVLTRGFWLADTTCTQALWRAVTGQSPNDFKGEDLPVEHVSWDDIQQQFIPRLVRTVPGLRLPTEAEWEYAARNAGHEGGQFCWGNGITTDQANYDGNHPLKGGNRGEYRRKTLPVRSFQPSPFGLWQLHGNVWEWVQDTMAEYGAEVVDPTGPSEQGATGQRVLRGGSRFDLARFCRSAQRNADVPSGRFDLIGFRLARGLPEQPASLQAEPGPVLGGPEARRAGDGAPASAAARQRGGVWHRIFGKDTKR